MYDPYYETKVNSINSRQPSYILLRFLGLLLMIAGLMLIAFTIVDLASGTSASNRAAWQENSIWPTIGKGIWVGGLVS